MVRGCVWAAASIILNGDTVTEDAGGESPYKHTHLLVDVERTYQRHRAELHDGKGGVDYRRLAELHRQRADDEPTLF